METGGRSYLQMIVQKSNSEVPVFSKILDCGAITASGLSKLDVLPPNQTVRAKDYHENLLPPFPSYGFVQVRCSDTGSVTELAIYGPTWQMRGDWALEIKTF
jgi:hypothetical protein